MQPYDPASPTPPSADWPAAAPVHVRVPPVQRTSPVLAAAIAVVTLLAGGALFMSGFLLGERAASQPGTPAADADAFQPFWDTYRAIDTQYAGGDVDQQALIRGAIRGMVEALDDPYSTYLTPEEYQTGLQDLSGQFEGIGAEIGTKDTTTGTTGECSSLGPECVLVIVAPIEGSPAEKADLRPGDEVLAVDGSGLEGLTVDGARDRVRGKKGTEVVLTIRRDGGKPFDVAVVRDTIVQREVIHEDLADGTIGYIRVTGFSDNAAEEYHEALESDIDAGRTKLILDLRGNPGGYVTAARRIASEFIASGPIFWEETASGEQEETSAQPGGLATSDEFQLVVLVDRGSASASEIVAGALRDRGRATIVGETTFGKGTVQTWIELPDTGALKLTIARWLTPDKHWIHGTGIEPDVVVELPGEVPAGEDPVRNRAIEILGGTGAAESGKAA